MNAEKSGNWLEGAWGRRLFTVLQFPPYLSSRGQAGTKMAREVFLGRLSSSHVSTSTDWGPAVHGYQACRWGVHGEQNQGRFLLSWGLPIMEEIEVTQVIISINVD